MIVAPQIPAAPVHVEPVRAPHTPASQETTRPVPGPEAIDTRADRVHERHPGEEQGRGGQEHSAEEKREIEQLKSRDREVRAHEAAHKAAAGSLARGGPTFEYESGPDGRRYAVGGEVQIDTSGVPGDPAETLRRAEIIQRAANAPAEPSPQDRAVAAEARAMAAEARQELAAQRHAESQQTDARFRGAEQVGVTLDVFA